MLLSPATEPVTDAAANVAGPAPALVQLPTDGRGRTTSYTRASTAIEGAAWLAGLSARNRPAEFLGTLVGLLARYSGQDNIALDVFLSSEARKQEDGRRRFTFSLSVELGDTTATLVERAFAELGALAEIAVLPSANAGHSSNVAVTFLDEGDDVAVALATAPAVHDVHFFVTGGAHPPLAVAYNANLFSPATLARLCKSLVIFGTAAGLDRALPIGQLPLLDRADVQAMLASWESGTASYPQEPVHRVFEAFAKSQPDAIAARFADQQLTYRELDARSSRLAHHLLAIGVRIETPVAVCVQPSLDVLVAFLAVWKAGAAYVPLDPTHPEALINHILDEVKPALVLTQAKVRHLTQRFAQFCFDTDAGLLEVMPTIAPPVEPSLDRACYLLYTSGTTGKPKGVRATHRNLAHYIHVAQQMYGFNARDVFCSMARYTFSISMFELVSPLCCGGSLRLFERDEVLAPDRLTRNLHDVTVLHAGPSLLGNLFRHLRATPPAPGAFDHLRHVSSGGDLVPPHIQEEMKVVFPNAEIFVIYGCTEVSCMGCTYPVLRDTKVTASFVGKAFPDVAVRVLDKQRNLCPIGVVGEICFAGKGVVDGYLQRPELNAEKFIEIPDHPGMRFYTTGDMGRVHADGNVEILGRRDFQIQLRGIRIELAGIENTVRELGLAANCAVVVKKLDEQDVRLIAFVVKPLPEVETIAAFRKALGAHLPDYMLPQGLVTLEALPLTANGKLDRGKLNELPWEPTKAGDSARTGPRNAVERQVAQAFASALGVPENNIGIDDDFFDLGGHSLLAVTVMQDVENKLGLTLPPGVLFERTTIRGLAEHATSSFKGSEQRPLLLAGDGKKPALFMLLGVHLYRPLAQLLQDKYSVFGVYAGRELVMFEQSGKAPPVDELAREYIEIIRRQQPHGPYRLGGMSFGGIVAYEVAQQLRAAGEEVQFLALLDAVLPEPGWRGTLSLARRLVGLHPKIAARAVAGRTRRRINAALGLRTRSEFVRYGSDDKLGAMEERRQEAYKIAVETYLAQMKPWRGEVTVVVSGRRLGRDPSQSPDCGWRAHIAPQDLAVHHIDADHIALVEEPKVEELAEIFRKGLGHTETRGVRPPREHPESFPAASHR